MRLTVLLAACAAAFSSSAWAVESCDAILIKQISSLDVRDRVSTAWLWSINEGSYESAKQQAGGSAYYGLFEGNYASFKDKRSQLQSSASFQGSSDLALEVYKSYLSEAQVRAWSDCKGSATEITTSYKDVTADGATVVFRWVAPSAVGPLRDITFSLARPGQTPQIVEIASLSGSRSIPIVRSDKSESLRGTINGVAGYSNESFTAVFFIPPFDDTPRPRRPLKMVRSLNDQTLTSIAYWSGGSAHDQWQCTQPSAEEEIIILSQKNLELGRRRGTCVGNGSFCDSAGESCKDVVIERGCAINRRWLDWYKDQLEMLLLAYKPENVCDPERLG